MIDEKVKKAIAEQFGVPETSVDLEKPLSELDADSLDLVELVMAVEDELDIEIPDHSFAFAVNAKDVTGRQLVELATRIKG